MIAAAAGHLQIVQKMLPNAAAARERLARRNNKSKTGLELAREAGHKDVVAYLEGLLAAAKDANVRIRFANCVLTLDPIRIHMDQHFIRPGHATLNYPQRLERLLDSLVRSDDRRDAGHNCRGGPLWPPVA